MSAQSSLVNLPNRKRRSIRWDLALSCRIHREYGWVPGHVWDASDEGAFIESEVEVEPGETVSILLEQGEEELPLEATVVHCRTYQTASGEAQGFGVHFSQPLPKILCQQAAAQPMETVAPVKLPTKPLPQRRPQAMDWLLELNREAWLVVSLIVISLIINFAVSSNQMVLGLYTLPTVFSAYFFGRRHATLTAFASVLLVVLITPLSGEGSGYFSTIPFEMWLQLIVWGGVLILTGYAMGTLYERLEHNVQELRETYHGVLLILQQFISNDKYTQNHSYRVSVYATRIAQRMGLDENKVEDVRAAALLHDVGKLDISRDILYKASRLTESEYHELRSHVDRGISLLEPVGGSLRRVLPIVLAHHDKFDGSGYHPVRGEQIPLAARIIAVADVFDAVTSDRPYRKAMSPLDAKEMIVKGSGTDFDPRVVQAFVVAFRMGEMEIPEIMV